VNKGAGVDYQFLLGRSFRLQNHVYVASALGKTDGTTIVRASTQIDGEEAMRIFPAQLVLEHLICDEEIELREVTFAR
jgi:hypothetical protein